MDKGQVLRLRREVLASLDAPLAALDPLLAYGACPFELAAAPRPALPLAEEGHLADWRRYAAEAAGDVLGYLRGLLPQLSVPIGQGVSGSDAYRAVMRRGEPFAVSDFGGTLALEQPAELRLSIHEHAAGALPVLATPNRADFETLSRALAFRSEPEPVSPAVNARMVAGVIDWGRVHRYRQAFQAEHGPQSWPAEMKRVAAEEAWRFHDRIMLTCARPYSGVSARELGLDLDAQEWLRRSDLLRVEHEFTHYATKRIWGTMSLNLLDETLCDFMGMTLALGRFEAVHFLRFMGLEAFPVLREDGRLLTYTGGLPKEAIPVAAALVVAAARGLERLSSHYDLRQRPRLLLALAALPLEALASPHAETLFGENWDMAAALLASEPVPALS